MAHLVGPRGSRAERAGPRAVPAARLVPRRSGSLGQVAGLGNAWQGRPEELCVQSACCVSVQGRVKTETYRGPGRGGRARMPTLRQGKEGSTADSPHFLLVMEESRLILRPDSRHG